MSDLCQAFSHAQLDSQSIEYFNVIWALRWLSMKKGVWRSDRPPQYFDLPCFCQHLYLYLNTPFHLSLRPRLKDNTHRIYQRLESDHGVREEWMFEIIWHWNDNSPSFSKRDGSLYIDVPLLYFYDQGLVLGHTFQSTQLCCCWIWSGWKGINRKRFSKIVTGFNLHPAPVHIE